MFRCASIFATLVLATLLAFPIIGGTTNAAAATEELLTTVVLNAVESAADLAFVGFVAASFPTTGTPANTIGSFWVTPNRNAAMKRASPNAAAVPTTIPANANFMPCQRIMLRTCEFCAPIAMRIPISCVRCCTEYAINP